MHKLQKTKKQQSFKIGDFVFLNDYSNYGKIVELSTYFRCRSGQSEQNAAIRYIDPNTGRLRVCPDSRCDSNNGIATGGCVICSRNRWIDEIIKFTPSDIELFKSEGIIKDDKTN